MKTAMVLSVFCVAGAFASWPSSPRESRETTVAPSTATDAHTLAMKRVDGVPYYRVDGGPWRPGTDPEIIPLTRKD
ncbi:MAG: hypothetical protein AB7K24_08940 [Gemmataceae bacterium]